MNNTKPRREKPTTKPELLANGPGGSAVATDRRQWVLVSVVGQSPGVLTETIWALATKGIIPHRVVAITTTQGRDAILRDLFAPAGDCVWDQFCRALQARGHDLTNRLKFGQEDSDIRVFTMFDPTTRRTIKLADITDETENLAAADFIMEQVRGLADDGTRLIGSVAGGRKTMGALLFAVMSLIGRRDDVLTHVLVNDPFDSQFLKPRFYFPVDPPIRHTLMDRDGNPAKDRDGKVISKLSDEARILLGRIPFVALRTLFERDALGSPTYSALVERCQTREEDYARQNVRLKMQRSRLLVWICDQEVRTSALQHLYLLFLAERAQQGLGARTNSKVLWDFNNFARQTRDQSNQADCDDWRDGVLGELEDFYGQRHKKDKPPVGVAEVPVSGRRGLGIPDNTPKLPGATKVQRSEGEFDADTLGSFCTRMNDQLKDKLGVVGWKALFCKVLPEKGRFSLNLGPSQVEIVD